MSSRRAIAIRAGMVVALFTAVVSALCLSRAHARDVGQWEGSDPETRAWFNTLRQPDNPAVSCCGEADAYWADTIGNSDAGQMVATITDARDDAPLGRRHIPIGTQFVIPSNKITWKHGNPTGHLIIFVNGRDQVLCFVQSGGV